MEPEEEKKILKPTLPSNHIYHEIPPKTFRTSYVVLLVVFIISTISCLTLLFLNGFGLTNLSDKVLCALIAATVAEIAGLIAMVFGRQIFKS